ncbi:MAG: DUF1853 family protein [Flavobacteriaceae bacterium]
MDSQNQLAKQFKGFLETPSLFEEIENFELFSISEKDTENFTDLSLQPIPNNLVLGKRVELFFQEFVKHSKRYSMLAANLQVIENKITLGELDFLIKDIVDHKFIHVELVNKFYVYDPEISGELKQWIGPNRRDTLLYKISKLQKKQLPLLHNTSTKQYLEQLNLSPEKFIQQVCFLGKLFVPVNLYGTRFPEINNRCIVGYWLTLEAFKERNEQKDVYYLPKKENWLTRPENNNVWVSFEEALVPVEKSLQNKKSLMCWKKTAGGKPEQFFIVWWK